MAYQHLIAIKVKLNGLGGYRKDIMRQFKVKKNPNIDLSRSYLNHAIENLSLEDLPSRVRQRIKQLHLKRKLRTDAVGLEDIVIGASADFMLQLDEEKREQYFKDALHFFQKHYGKENVMYCHCHLDEHNPHVHIGVIPVTPDGRLSARDLFNPKSLEKLQTDFHREVAQHYGLKRGEHHSRNYLELNQFKLQRTKQEIQEFTADLDSALLQQEQVDQIMQSAHFVSTGILFKSEDKERSELPTQKLIQLQQTAEQGLKANAAVRITQQQNSQLKHEKAQAIADSQHYRNLFQALEKETALYTAVPPLWREHVDSSILNWQKIFSVYCHDVNRATIRVFLASHGNYHQTEKIMHDFIKKTCTNNVHKYVANVIHAANLQHKDNFQPTTSPPSWKKPKPEDTNYSKPDELGVVSLQLSRVSDINWDMINWDLLSELEKDEIRHKKMIRELFGRT